MLWLVWMDRLGSGHDLRLRLEQAVKLEVVLLCEQTRDVQRIILGLLQLSFD